MLRAEPSWPREGSSAAESAEGRAVSLFCGAGGFCAGVQLAGYKIVCAVENDETAVKTHSANFPGVRLPSVRDLCTRIAPWLIRPLSGIGSGGSSWSMRRRSATCRPTHARAIATCSSCCCRSSQSARAYPWASCP
ncbi:MAG: DNA cytosine methyltransferase [Hyphomicrobiaceae bacterium]